MVDRRSQRPRVIGLVLGIMASLGGLFADEAPRPNIVLVMADDLGWGQIGYRGHPYLEGRTPHLDAMAEAGLRFNRFYAAAPICSPTRASVLTGRVPARTGTPGLHKRLCLQEKTLSQALKDAGYATGFFGKWHLNGVKGPGVPILPDDPNHPGFYGFDEWLAVTNFFDMDPLMSRNGSFEYLPGESSEVIVGEALDFIAARQGRPSFTVIWYGSPHHAFFCRPEDREGFPAGKHGDQLGEIVALDRSVGMLRQGLRELGIEKDTLIWFTSDNGGLDIDPDSVGGLSGHKGSLNEGGIRVPAIIEWPGVIESSITAFPSSTMDIMPTMVDLLDLPEDSQLAVVDGESILPLFGGKVPERKGGIPFTTKGMALIEGRFKLLQTGKGSSLSWSLYDLESDPKESMDLAGRFPERVQRMRSELERLMMSIEASASGKDYPEGRVLQPQRTQSWFEMEAYQELYDTFVRLKPDWRAPGAPRAR